MVAACVGHSQGASGADTVLGIGERGHRAKGLQDGCPGAFSTLPPLGTTGSKISTWPLPSSLALKFVDV